MSFGAGRDSPRQPVTGHRRRVAPGLARTHCQRRARRASDV